MARSHGSDCVIRPDCSPSEPQTTGPMAGSSLRPTTAAPAPSAKMNALERSSWLVMSDSRSTPITSAYVDAPVRTSESASVRP